ncbi:MAG TPA: PAS domain S-box protein [Candidatus Eisenbacteria bacterium]|nr:PAS domain S-box protein [Candidatus Eisenbacteria bacterium]
MKSFWSFDRRMTSGFAIMAVIVMTTSLAAMFTVRSLIPFTDDRDARGAMYFGALRLQSGVSLEVTNAQAFILGGRPQNLTLSRNWRTESRALLSGLQAREKEPTARRLLDEIAIRHTDLERAMDAVIALRSGNASSDVVMQFYRSYIAARRNLMDRAIERYVEHSRVRAQTVQDASRESLVSLGRWTTATAIVALVLFTALAFPLRRTLLRLYETEARHHATAARARRAAEDLATSRAEGQETTRLILEKALDGVISADAEGRITGWNPEAERMFGWSTDEILGNLARATIVPPRYHRILDEWLPRVAASGDAPVFGRRIEIAAIRRDGTEFPIEITLSALRREGVHFSAFVRDISERRRIDEQIRESEEEFRATFEHAGVGYAQLDLPECRFTRVNHKLCEILGYSAAELLGLTLADVAQPGDPDVNGSAAAAAPCMDEESAEMPLRRKDGQTVHALVTTTLIHREEGGPRRALSVIQDLSDLRQAQSALRATEQRFQLMADSAPVLVWVTGPDGLNTWFNRPWLEFTGRTMTQELGNGWMDGIHPSDREGFASAFREAFRARQPFTSEFRLRRHDGKWRWIIDHGIPLDAEDGAPGGYIGSCMDITDRKRSEDQRERLLASERAARSEAERASRMKDEFLATLSHELRTPLQATLGWSRLLLDEGLDAQQIRRGLETIERNVTLQKRLIEDLLDMSRIVQGKTRLEVKRIDPREAIEAALDVVRPAAEAKGITLRTDLQPIAHPVTADPQRLQQMVWNLLSNAIKFTPAGGTIEVTLREEPHRILIAVADTGSGIDAAFLPYVFERFRQQDASTTRRHGGLGLGLAIVRHLVEHHGGRVTASSPGEGLGSTFTLELPRHAVTAPGDDSSSVTAPPAPDSTLASGKATFDGLRVLVVDDEPDACELLHRVFSDRGADVVAVRSAAEALELFVRFKPQVLVSDIGMPGTDGYELMRRIRKRENGKAGRIPSLALTAFARPEDRERALAAGFHAHLAKPVEPGELVAAVFRLLTPAPAPAGAPAGAS